MTSRNQQGKERVIGTICFEIHCQQVRLHVVYRDRRDAPGVGQAPADTGPNQQCPDQPGTGGVGNSVDASRIQPGLLQGSLQQRRNAPDMVAGRQFGHHAAVGLVYTGLAVKLVRQQAVLRIVNGDSGLVTRGFYSQDTHLILISGVRVKILANFLL